MSYQDFKFEHHYQENTFNAVLTEQLKKTPWLLISFIIHAIILLILSQFQVSGQEEQDVVPFNVSDNETMMEEEEMPIVEEETEEINPEEEVTEEPVVKDTEISDHNETDNNEEWEESKGEEDQISDKPFDGTQTNDAIGLGGGGGGAFGGRRGGKRNLRAAGGGGRTQKAVEEGLEWLMSTSRPTAPGTVTTSWSMAIPPADRSVTARASRCTTPACPGSPCSLSSAPATPTARDPTRTPCARASSGCAPSRTARAASAPVAIRTSPTTTASRPWPWPKRTG